MRPLGVGEVIDVSINLFTRNLRALLTIAAAVVVPVTLVIFGLDLIALQEAGRNSSNAALYEIGDELRVLDEQRYVTVTIIQAIITILAYLVVTGAAFRGVSEAYLGRTPDVGASVRYAGRRAHSLLWLGILMMVGIGIGFVLLVIPGIWLLVAWAVAVPALMVEGARGTKAIGRSFGLTRQHWWRTLGALLVGFIFIALIEFLLGLAAAAFDGVATDSVYLWAAFLDALNAVSVIITAPLQAAIITVIYFDLRVRKEGFDVEVLARQLDDPTATPAPPGGGTPAQPSESQPQPPSSPPAAGA